MHSSPIEEDTLSHEPPCHHGCAIAVGYYYLPSGCPCFDNKYQWLCEQHLVKLRNNGYEAIPIFERPSDPASGDEMKDDIDRWLANFERLALQLRQVHLELIERVVRQRAPASAAPEGWQLTGPMWVAARRKFVELAQRFQKAETHEAEIVVSDIAPQAILNAAALSISPPLPQGRASDLANELLTFIDEHPSFAHPSEFVPLMRKCVSALASQPHPADSVREALEAAAQTCELEAVAYAADIVPGDEIGEGEAHARAGALLTAAQDIRALHSPAQSCGTCGGTIVWRNCCHGHAIKECSKCGKRCEAEEG